MTIVFEVGMGLSTYRERLGGRPPRISEAASAFRGKGPACCSRLFFPCLTQNRPFPR